MSRSYNLPATVIPGFPRVSGDEPNLLPIGGLLPTFSPRERG